MVVPWLRGLVQRGMTTNIDVKITIPSMRLTEGQREEHVEFPQKLLIRLGTGNNVIIGTDNNGWIVDWNDLCEAVKLAWEHKS